MKSNRKIIFKNLILLAVLIVCISLVGFAWFAEKTDANASGLNVKADTGLGLEASFDDGVTSAYATKLTKYVNSLYPLISGDGQNFFIPQLNLTTGVPVTETDGSWISKKDPEKNVDYYEQDIWFRSTQEMELFLKNTSEVTSDNIKNQISGNTFANKSPFGDFTRDFIAGASRVSFSEITTGTNGVETETLKYIWIPNEKYELLGSSEFTALERNTDGQGTEGGISTNPDETFGLTDTDKYISTTDPNYTGIPYHLSEAYTEDGGSTYKTQFKHMYQSLSNGKIYGTIDILTTNYVDHAFDITTSAKLSDSTTSLSYDKTSSNTCPLDNYTYNNKTYNWIQAFFDGNYNYGDLVWAKLVIEATPDDDNQFFTDIDRFQVLVEYDPDNGNTIKVVGFVFYNSETGLGSSGQKPVTYYSYSMTEGKQVIITGDSDDITYALTASNGSLSSTKVTLIDNKITCLDSNAMFTVEPDDSESDSHVYYLRSVATGQYLYVDDSNNLKLSASGKTAFTLSAGTSGPLLSYNNLYLSFGTNGEFIMSATAYGSTNIYQGDNFNVNPTGNAEEAYYFYNTTTNKKEVLASNKYVLTGGIDSAPALATFVKESSDSEYYKAHIRIRVWAEGTDREAQFPLASGTFNTLLNFEGKLVTTSSGS